MASAHRSSESRIRSLSAAAKHRKEKAWNHEVNNGMVDALKQAVNWLGFAVKVQAAILHGLETALEAMRVNADGG